MKESFIKQAGKGLSLPLDSFSVKLNEQGRASVETPQAIRLAISKPMKLTQAIKWRCVPPHLNFQTAL